MKLFLIKTLCSIMLVVVIFGNMFPLGASNSFFEVSGGAFKALCNFAEDAESNVLGFFDMPLNISYNDDILCMRVRFQSPFGDGVRYADFIAKKWSDDWVLAYSNLDGVSIARNRLLTNKFITIFCEVDDVKKTVAQFSYNTLDGSLYTSKGWNYKFLINVFSEENEIVSLTYRDYLTDVRKNSSLYFYDYYYDNNHYDN